MNSRDNEEYHANCLSGLIQGAKALFLIGKRKEIDLDEIQEELDRWKASRIPPEPEVKLFGELYFRDVFLWPPACTHRKSDLTGKIPIQRYTKARYNAAIGEDSKVHWFGHGTRVTLVKACLDSKRK